MPQCFSTGKVCGYVVAKWPEARRLCLVPRDVQTNARCSLARREQAYQVQQAGNSNHEIERDHERVLSCAERQARHAFLSHCSSNPQLLRSTAPEAIMVRCCSKCLLLSVRTSRAVASSCSDGTRGSGAALERRGEASAGAPHAAASCSTAKLERRRRARVFIGRGEGC